MSDEILPFDPSHADGFAASARGMGLGRRLVEHTFAVSGAERIGLLSTPEAESFYRGFSYRDLLGLRLFREPAVDRRPRG